MRRCPWVLVEAEVSRPVISDLNSGSFVSAPGVLVVGAAGGGAANGNKTGGDAVFSRGNTGVGWGGQGSLYSGGGEGYTRDGERGRVSDAAGGGGKTRPSWTGGLGASAAYNADGGYGGGGGGGGPKDGGGGGGGFSGGWGLASGGGQGGSSWKDADAVAYSISAGRIGNELIAIRGPF